MSNKRRKPCNLNCRCLCHDIGGGNIHPNLDCRNQIIRRFVIVNYIAEKGYYTLTDTNQSQNHFDDKESAIKTLESLKPSLNEKLGIKDVIVIEADCYISGDCRGTVFSTDYVNSNKV